MRFWRWLESTLRQPNQTNWLIWVITPISELLPSTFRNKYYWRINCLVCFVGHNQLWNRANLPLKDICLWVTDPFEAATLVQPSIDSCLVVRWRICLSAELPIYRRCLCDKLTCPCSTRMLYFASIPRAHWWMCTDVVGTRWFMIRTQMMRIVSLATDLNCGCQFSPSLLVLPRNSRNLHSTP